MPNPFDEPEAGIPPGEFFQQHAIVNGQDIDITPAETQQGIVDIAGDMVDIALRFTGKAEVRQEILQFRRAGQGELTKFEFASVVSGQLLRYPFENLLDAEENGIFFSIKKGEGLRHMLLVMPWRRGAFASVQGFPVGPLPRLILNGLEQVGFYLVQ
jgi:hypothetical protein